MLTGLSSDVAAQRLTKFGPNTLPEKKPARLFSVFFLQFKNPFIYILFAAASLSFVLEQYINSLFIMIVLLLNALIGTIQEFSAETAAAALKKIVPHFANVWRDGKNRKIRTEDVVPGDLVNLVSGDKVPADILLTTITNLLVDESLLTGESSAIQKQIHQEGEYKDSDISLKNIDPQRICYAGTIVNSGRAQGIVVATGSNTQIGTIATEVSSDISIKPPLLQRIEKFSLMITYVMLVLIFLLFVITVMRGESLSEIFLLAVALAVSAIPEGLPAAITIALAIGMRRMARVGVIVRRLLAVEALGSCTYIASDKTGTLTVNEMTIKKIMLPDGHEFGVTGTGIDLHGSIQGISEDDKNKSQLEKLCYAGAFANESYLEFEQGEWQANGDMVDIAFIVLANKYGIDQQSLKSNYRQISAIPYESEMAFSASINRFRGKVMLSVKGSPEHLLEMCSKTDDGSALNKDAITRQTNILADQGYRVMAIATAQLDNENVDPQSVLHDLTFNGLVGMIDPLRPETKQAIENCRQAHIEVAMITGDHPKTAQAIARELNIGDMEKAPITGQDIDEAMNNSDGALDQLISSNKVFARINPTHKKIIIDSLIRQGNFVAVTGDGVNDAPALRHAHVGIAMGKRGTDVARESSDLILTDDNFSSIINGIKQGRIVYGNIRKVIFLLISTGAAEVTLFIFSMILALPMPLLPIQLLWLNLVTNGLQDVALAFEPEEGDELKQKPRPPNERIFNRLMLERIIINAITMGCIAFALFYWLMSQGIELESARNIVLLQMVLFENIHVFNSRSETVSIFQQKFLGNPFLLIGMLSAQLLHIASMYIPVLEYVLQVEPVTLQLWFTLLAFAFVLILVDEVHKYIHKRTLLKPVPEIIQ